MYICSHIISTEKSTDNTLTYSKLIVFNCRLHPRHQSIQARHSAPY